MRRICIALGVVVIGGCRDSLPDRSLVFFTGTTFGLEVSANPSNATGPAQIIIGYKRGEGVLDPVYHSQGVEAPVMKTTTTSGANGAGSTVVTEPVGGQPGTVKRYREQAYSVIAKFSGESSATATANANGKLSFAQWFATGAAAESLAKQPGIAGAVTGSAEIAKESVAAAKFDASLDGLNQVYMLKFLQDVGAGLRILAAGGNGSAGDAKAKDFQSQLKSFVQSAAPSALLTYSPGGASGVDVVESQQPIGPDLISFASAIESLEQSNGILKAQLAKATFTLQPAGGGSVVTVTSAGATDPAFQRLTTQLATNQQILAQAKERLASDSVVLKAVEYYLSVITGKKAG